jgi:hypothetical protein
VLLVTLDFIIFIFGKLNTYSGGNLINQNYNNRVKRLTLIAILFLFLVNASKAWMIVYGADISFRADTGNNFIAQIKVVTHKDINFFTDSANIKFGDSLYYSIPLKDTIEIGNNLILATFERQIVFPLNTIRTDSILRFYYGFPSRHQYISNINFGNSLPVGFCIEGEINLVLLQELGTVTSPYSMTYPVDYGFEDSLYRYNLSFVDSQGMALIIESDTPKYDPDINVPAYYFPDDAFPWPSSYTLDSQTIEWNIPEVHGYFDVAFKVSKYWNGRFVCSAMRDMLIVITDNQPNRLERVSELQYAIVPNPANDRIRISLSQTCSFTYAIFSIDGKQYLQHPVTTNYAVTEIDITPLPPGIYLIAIQSPQGNTVKRFIKM